MAREDLFSRIPSITDSLVESIREQPKLQRLGRVFLPSRDVIVGCIDRLMELTFPGFFGRQGLSQHNITYRTGELVMELTELLFDQIRRCLRYRRDIPDDAPSTEERCEECDAEAGRIVAEFYAKLPGIRALLATDVQAAFDADPAATSTDETIFCYPGLHAIAVQRLAHAFFGLGVPLLPRIMTEHAHSRTGIDIHPGAQLGESFFIDHGTGVVIGETTVIGRNVKLYQGVTLGALAPAYGQMLRGQKRHPTIEDDVVIYAGATILGGETVIGKGSVIGGNVFLTNGVPPHNTVIGETPKLKFRDRRKRAKATEDFLDFQI
jgi:serine O-acetyltransferase